MMKKINEQACRGCIYSVRYRTNGYYCDYLTRVGKRRPCPGGKECTERKTYRELQQEKSVDRNKVVQMRKQGIGVRAIAEHFGCTTGWIYVLLGEAGMTHAAQQRKKEQEEKEKKDE